MESLFAYGTLRPGSHNHDLLERVARQEQTAHAEGLALYDGPGFPYAAPARDSRITGTLSSIADEDWPAALRALDALEGYDPILERASHYIRRRWPVLTASGAQTEAWIYLAGPRVDLDIYDQIHGGDWLRRATPTSPTRSHIGRRTHHVRTLRNGSAPSLPR